MKLICTGIICLIVGMLDAQSILFSENFEGGFNQAWKFSIEDTLVPVAKLSAYTPAWIVTPNKENLEDSVAGSCSFFSPIGKANRWLISPAINLTANNNIFSWKAHSLDPSYPDSYQVLLSRTGDNIADFTKVLLTQNEETAAWNSHEIVLNDLGYSSQTVYLAFVLQTNDGFVLELDDIEVRDELFVSLEDNQLTKLSIYPNPVSNELFVKSDELPEKLILTSISGKILKETSFSNALSLEDLSSGIYWLKVKTSNQWDTFRVIKN